MSDGSSLAHNPESALLLQAKNKSYETGFRSKGLAGLAIQALVLTR